MDWPVDGAAHGRRPPPTRPLRPTWSHSRGVPEPRIAKCHSHSKAKHAPKVTHRLGESDACQELASMKSAAAAPQEPSAFDQDYDTCGVD